MSDDALARAERDAPNGERLVPSTRSVARVAPEAGATAITSPRTATTKPAEILLMAELG